MESLPIDAIEVICQYLSEQDMFACGSVCCSWRFMFNNDTIWRPLCSQRKQVEEHLRTTSCRVNPWTAIAERPNSSLVPICQWKLAKMRENRLWSNIHEGNFVETNIVHDAALGVPCAQGFLTDDHVFLIFEKIIEVWDVRLDPTVKVSENPHEFTSVEIKSFRVVGEEKNRAMVIDGFKVQLFQIDRRTGKLDRFTAFKFDETQCGASQENAEDSKPKCIVSGSSLVGVNRGHSSVLHIWDLVRGTKIIEDNIHMPGFCIINIIGSPMTTNVAIVLAPENQKFWKNPDYPITWFSADKKHYVHKVYCLKEARLFQFQTESHWTIRCKCAILNDFITILDNYSLRIFNYKTHELIHEGIGAFQRNIMRDVVLVVGDYFLFNSPSCHLEVYNPKTKLLYIDNKESGLDNYNAYISYFTTMKLLEELYTFGKSCFQVRDKEAFQVTEGNLIKLGISNCKGMNFSGTRYLTISNQSSSLKENTRQLVIVRQFW